MNDTGKTDLKITVETCFKEALERLAEDEDLTLEELIEGLLSVAYEEVNSGRCGLPL